MSRRNGRPGGARDRAWLARVLIVGLALLALAAAPARAHRGSESQLHLVLQGAQVGGDWAIGLHDLAPPGSAGAAPDDLASAQAWLAGRPDLAARAMSRLQLAADGQACALTLGRAEVVTGPAGPLLQLQLSGLCPSAPELLTVDYRLLFDTDPRHQGLLRLQAGDLVRPAVFTAESPSQQFALRAPGPWQRAAADLLSGLWHIWTGWDHLLFLLCLLMPAVLAHGPRAPGAPAGERSLGPVLADVLAVVTAFTLAHSITLSAAALHWVSLPARFTESMIAASVVLAAALNLRPVAASRRWQAAFGFGLIHGFGFASALDDMGVPAAGLLPTLLAFNVGVELGQLAVVALLLPLAYAARNRTWYRPRVLRAGSALIAVIALMWLIERAFQVSFMPVH